MLKLGWFSTGRGPGSRNLLKSVKEAIDSGYLDAEISFVFCNWDNTEEDNPKREQRQIFFDQVKSYGIPLVTESWKKFKPELRKSDEKAWGLEYGKVLRQKTQPYGMDLGILAGYMLWMDDDTCDAYDMLNLHPALPDGPKGTWQEVIWQLIASEAKDQGVMIHICTKEHDRGEALTFCRFPIRGGEWDALWDQLHERMKTKSLEQIKEEEGINEPLFRRIREKGAMRELPLITETIKLFADGKVEMKNKRLYRDGRALDGPYDLTEEVDGAIKNA
jgi:phosphoribosylglycinamide formyltransferase-1